MKINERGYWMNNTAEGHQHDEGLADALVKFFRNEEKETTLRILDIGCGDGFYSWKLFDNHFIIKAVDGNPNTVELTKELGTVLDFSVPVDTGARDWVLCLEVGEHIPEEFEKVFLDNLDRHNKYGMVISWAIPLQGGDGHVNCKGNFEVIEKISNMGYTFDYEETEKLRNNCAQYPNPGYWFRNTLMVFRKNSYIPIETCSLGYEMA